MHVLAFLGGGLLHPLGVCAGTHVQIVACRGYNFWSGIGSDIGEAAILTGLVAVYRKHKCGHCWRPGRHVVHVQREDGHAETHPSCATHLDHDHAKTARA